MIDTYDLIVIGTGVSGISAALAARAVGRSVLVIERATHYGRIHKIDSRKNGERIEWRRYR